MSLAVEVTVSGGLKSMFKTPDGKLHRLPVDAWKPSSDTVKTTVNVLHVLEFKTEVYPIIEVTLKKKPVSKLYEWWWAEWDYMKVYDVAFTKTGEKKVTFLKFDTGSTAFVDEDESVFRNALDGIILEKN